MVVFYSRQFVRHTPPPGHPERPERAGVFDAVVADVRAAGGDVHDVRAASREDLLRVHTAALVDDMASRSGRASMIDADTFTSPETYDLALLAAGASVEAAKHAFDHGKPTLALVRPPGHHAEPDRAMGFCLFNNVAVAAAALRASGVDRVAIVDIDVHHGNGTQAAFYSDPTVFYASTHQFPYYPGTGASHERGAGAGEGTTLNVPLAAGTRDDAFIRACEQEIIPALDSFRPSALLVSAGFDAHYLDPLGGLRVTTEGYGRVMSLLDEASRRLCGRRAAWITEGGYHLEALRSCLDAAIDVLS